VQYKYATYVKAVYDIHVCRVSSAQFIQNMELGTKLNPSSFHWVYYCHRC